MKKIILSTLIITCLFSCKKDAENKYSEDNLDSLEVNDKSIDSLDLKRTNKKSIKQLQSELTAKGFETFEYITEETKDTVLMQQYFMVFLKSGPVRAQNEEEVELLHKEHLEYLAKMYALGYIDISGSVIEKAAIRDVTIYNVPTAKMADSLAKDDPMVKNGNLVVEVHPWWAPKGFSLR
jgi:uncharacterized protein YciI